MGISCGALQWNIGMGSLQPMVRAVGENAVLAEMPTLGAEMWQACNSGIANGLAIVRRWQSGTRLTPAARKELANLMGSAPMRAQQDALIGDKARAALREAAKWAGSAGRPTPTKREFLWFFDLLTQNGGLEGQTIAKVRDFIANAGPGKADDIVCDFLKGMSGTSGHVGDAHANADLWRGTGDALMVELLVLSFLRSGTASPRFRHVVLNRKGTIAMGKGKVNSKLFDFTADMA
jgi:hypothetical protein